MHQPRLELTPSHEGSMPITAPSSERPLFFGGSVLARSHGARSQSCGSFKKMMPKQNPLDTQKCSPSARLLAPIDRRHGPTAALTDDACLWETSPPGKVLRSKNKYLAPLSLQHSTSSPLASTCHMDWSIGSKQPSALAIKYDSTLADSVVEWHPKESSKLSMAQKKSLDMTSRFRISIPRPLSFLRPQRQERTADLSILNWPRQVNSRLSDSGPSGMLLRVERLRQAVIQMHGELRKNRSSLKVLRQSFQCSRGEEMLALPSSASSPSMPSQGKPQVSVVCSVTGPIDIITAELKDVLDRDEQENDE